MEGRKIENEVYFHEDDCFAIIGKKNTKYYLFEKVPNKLIFYSPSGHREFNVIREEGQIHILYFVVMDFFSLYNLEKMKRIKQKCKEKYSNKVKITFVAVTFRLYDFHPDEKEHFHNFEESIFLFEKYNCVFQNKAEQGLVYIDSNGIIQYINGINGFQLSKYIDEKDIMIKIDLLINNKPLIRKFTKEEFTKWNNEVNNFCNNCEYNFDEVFSGLNFFQHVYQDEDQYFTNMHINFDYIKDRNKTNEALNVLSSFFQKYIDDGVIVSPYMRYKEKKLNLKINNMCYKCKKVIDRKKEYSYLCIKCTNEGVIKQYCENCVRFFDSFKKFGSQLTILNDIEEYNKYLNNHTLDDKPCNNEHLLLFLPRLSQFVDNGQTKYQDVYIDEKDISFFTDLPTYLEYSPPTRINIKCFVCDQLSNYISTENVKNIDYKNVSFDNSLYGYYTQDGNYNEMRHIQRTVGTYAPIFYCPLCRGYFDWECFYRFNRYIYLRDDEYFDYQFLRHNYENEKYEKNEIFEDGTVNYGIKVWDWETIKTVQESETLTDECIAKIEECIKTGIIEMESKIHKAWHPCIIIQAKNVRLAYYDYVFPAFYRNIKV